MNTAAVFRSVLFRTWLCGSRGTRPSIPITVIVKVQARRVEPLEPMAELSGDRAAFARCHATR